MTDTQIDLLKTALDWTKAEMFSSSFFALCGLIFIAASYGFWQFGKTDTAKAYIIPLLVVGGLLIILGIGLVISNQIRLSQFPTAFSEDAAAFLTSELERAGKTMNGYNNAIYRFVPLIIIICTVALIFLKAPIWQASMVAVIAMMAVILLVDSNALARIEAYQAQLIQIEKRP